MTLFLTFIVATFVSMALIPPLMKVATQLRFVDLPNERKLHQLPIPRVGGVAMICGAILPILVWADVEPRIIALLIGMGIVFLFGLWDDWRDVDFRLKFLGQLLAVLVVIVYGGILIRHVPMLGDYPLPTYLAVPLTVFVLLGITNAINLSDGLDGLAGGTTLMSLGILAALAFIAEQTVITLIALAVIGGIMGFIRFNTYPARVFMGDAGSQFLGFTVGVLSLLLTQQPDSMYSYALPLVILALPILDTTMVIAQRLYQRRSPFRADKNHIHHKLLALGLDHHEAVFALYCLQALLFVCAYFLRYESDAIAVGFFIVFGAVTFGFLYWARTNGWLWREHSSATRPVQVDTRRWRRAGRVVFRSMLMFVGLSIPAYLLIGARMSSRVSPDITLLAAAMMLALLVYIPRRARKTLSWVERCAVYVTISMVVYLTQLNATASNVWLYMNVFFVTQAVALVLALRYSPEKRFEPTTLDFLVLFVAIAVPNLPGLGLIEAGVTETIARSVVMLYGIELVLSHTNKFYPAVRWVFCLALGLTVFNGVVPLVASIG